MYDPLPETVAEAEILQERVLRAQGYDPDFLLSELSKGPHAPLPLQVAESIDLVKLLREGLNEKAYDPSPRFRRHLNQPILTKYDKGPFLQRFANIRALCNEHYNAPEMARNVFVSSLPLSLINGVCVKFRTGQTVIFLNEGVLYFAPLLLRSFSEIPGDEAIWQRMMEGVPTGEEGPKITEALGDFLGMLLSFVSDETTPNTLYNGREKFLPHAYETWKIQQSLRRQVAQATGIDIPEGVAASDRRKEVLFYRIRGCFIFLLAHEFSHFYRDHHTARASGQSLLTIEALDELLERLHAVDPFFKTLDRNYLLQPEFCLYQIQEREADLDALGVLSKYVRDHTLEDHQVDALAFGANFFFLLTEIVERIWTTKRKGLEYAHQIAQLDPELRDILLLPEHPSPLSRIPTAVDLCDGVESRLSARLLTTYETMAPKLHALWGMIVHHSDMIFPKLELSRMLDFDGLAMFENHDALGHLRPRYR